MGEMAPLATGIQLADENLAERPAPFMAPENLLRLDAMRASRDASGRFHALDEPPMMAARPKPGRHLGWSPEDKARHAYAKHLNTEMAPLSGAVLDGLAHGAVAAELLPSLRDVAGSAASDAPFVNAYALERRGGFRVALRTPLPGVLPHMVDWWFGWHGDSAERYKLWHPRAHVHAEWATAPPPGSRGRERYVGQTSIVDEYVGGELGRYAIQFLPPGELGFDPQTLDDSSQATAVCARAGLADLPLNAGYLVHYVRAVQGGSEMRSYFWVGGPYAAARAGGRFGSLAVALARNFVRQGEADARALFTHCAEEMAHLATFLPALYAEQATGPVLGHD
jgi:hypothetical protein